MRQLREKILIDLLESPGDDGATPSIRWLKMSAILCFEDARNPKAICCFRIPTRFVVGQMQGFSAVSVHLCLSDGDCFSSINVMWGENILYSIKN